MISATCSDGSAVSAINLEADETVTCTFTNTKRGSISGFKWHDADMSGTYDSGTEAKLDGWTIFIDENDNGILDDEEVSTVTSGDGNYSFTNLIPGTYKICEVMQNNWSQTYPLNSNCHTVDLSAGQNITDKNFGNINEREGTIGLWRNWNRHKKYSEYEINGWLGTINTSSSWLMTEARYSADTTGMVNLINDAAKYCSTQPDKITCAQKKFLAQYMVMRLNVLSGRKSLSSVYDLSSFSAAMSYLGISPTNAVTMSTLITKIESKAPPSSSSPNRNQYLQMMSVCDYINNLGI